METWRGKANQENAAARTLLRLAKINAFAAEAGTIMIYSGLRISVQMVMFHNMAHFLASFSQLSRDISAIVYAESDT